MSSRPRFLAVATTFLVVVAVTVNSSAARANTYAETVGVNTHTWTNYSNAGGTAGPIIPAYSTVQIACALTGFRVANGNTWWYRIAQSPWNNSFYASADAFYNNGQTSGSLKGTPWVDPAVPICGQEPPPQPAPPPTVTLAQGPQTGNAFRYAITLRNFPANQGISVRCYDSVSPGGFYVPFTMNTDGTGYAFTQNYCFSADGPDHWVVAGGVASNHVSWGAAGGSSGGGSPSTGGGSQNGGGQTQQSSPTGPFSVFYSGTGTDKGVSNLKADHVADKDFALGDWSGNCKSDKAVAFDAPNLATLSGWSRGRLGPIYFLSAAGADRVAKIRTIVLFDPGTKQEISAPDKSFWDHVFFKDGTKQCDMSYDINKLLADWLRSNSSNRLFIFAGAATENKGVGHDFGGIWTYYIAGIWADRSIAPRAFICDYDNMGHEDVVRNFYGVVKAPPSSCPAAPPGYTRTEWHP